MKLKHHSHSKKYLLHLKEYLKDKKAGQLVFAVQIGEQAIKNGIKILDIAKFHEKALVTHLLPTYPLKDHQSVIKKAGSFFAKSILPFQKIPHQAKSVPLQYKKTLLSLTQRTIQLATSNQKLIVEIQRRKRTESSLIKSRDHRMALEEESIILHQKLKRLSRLTLLAQEEERKMISRELHDVIAQTLTGINIRLSSLKKQTSLDTIGFKRNLTKTQRLVEKSVNMVHDFARDLRPSVLDDLGIIPALNTFMKTFTTRTGIRTYLHAFEGIKKLESSRRTALFRVAQEALTNVAKHSKASFVKIHLHQQKDEILMKIQDDGKSFSVEKVLREKNFKHLGLLTMKERMEMVGGRFAIQSKVGSGTTLFAYVPFNQKSHAITSIL